MKLNRIMPRFIFPLLLVAFGVSGCFEDREQIFEDQLLEWEPPNRTTNALILDISLEADETEPRTAELRIQYAGPHVPNALTGVYEVVESESSAVEGEHFTIEGDKSLSIPANSSHSEELQLTIHSDAFAPGEDLEILLRITEASSVPPMENYKDFIITVSKDAAAAAFNLKN